MLTNQHTSGFPVVTPKSMAELGFDPSSDPECHQASTFSTFLLAICRWPSLAGQRKHASVPRLVLLMSAVGFGKKSP